MLMKNFDVSEDSFDSKQVGSSLIVRLRVQSTNILTDLDIVEFDRLHILHSTNKVGVALEAY